MYFSFIGSYTSGLVLPAAAGILAHMLQVKHGMAGRATILCVAHVWLWVCGCVCGCVCGWCALVAVCVLTVLLCHCVLWHAGIPCSS